MYAIFTPSFQKYFAIQNKEFVSSFSIVMLWKRLSLYFAPIMKYIQRYQINILTSEMKTMRKLFQKPNLFISFTKLPTASSNAVTIPKKMKKNIRNKFSV